MITRIKLNEHKYLVILLIHTLISGNLFMFYVAIYIHITRC